ncbi:transcription termination factor Rho [Candidatus Fokinia crypta]|uniref:Transcription termination factor Rho n=1 Tax=Candidatus Fokinia crypta TaxID=1920990 RepID=A0ABZ0USC5_9RICK|nr:transcription termination factor Rho [Candidatus Fokinia cryptica]WPX97603.1 Transcription termination factor Rho [Candidatus Fokinia cryptica]
MKNENKKIEKRSFTRTVKHRFVRERKEDEQMKDEREEIATLDYKYKDNAEIYWINDIRAMDESQLLDLQIKVERFDRKSDEVVHAVNSLIERGSKVLACGLLDVIGEGFGFLRACGNFPWVRNFEEIYVPSSYIKRYSLRSGDMIVGAVKSPKRGENKNFSLANIEMVNDVPVTELRRRVNFDDLVPVYPDTRIDMSDIEGDDLSCRIVDMISPIGFGQRALVVAPPKTGKTILMQNIINAISRKYHDCTVMVLLIGERPEEVTEMERFVKGEVYSSTFDEPSQNYVNLAEMVLNRAKRLVETGKDVVIMLDSITRLARAYNEVAPSSGRILSGGVDSGALYRPKRFFGAARNIENGGSLTIIGTTLVDTGSKMDDVIFEEFKGTGNSEIVLSRRLADKRIFPAMDIFKSGTRKEELLIDAQSLKKIWVLRKILSDMNPEEVIELLKERMKNTSSNAEFFTNMITNKMQ